MDIPVTRTTTPKARPPEAELGFGKHFSDHMFLMNYVAGKGWHQPRIVPYGPLPLDPAAAVLHYAQEMFEGTKAFRCADGSVAMFRPQANSKRMATGAPRLCMQCPTEAQMTQAMKALVEVEADWVPRAPGTALYLRPTLIATEAFLGVRPAQEYLYFIICSPVGNYYGGHGLKTVRIWVETHEVRAARGGLGASKAGANYAASLHAAQKAKERGFDQVLWMDAHQHASVEEVGTMNLFAVLDGTLVTPPLSDSILAGVTRDSVLTLARDLGWKVEVRPVSLDELKTAHAAGKLTEVFGAGTAAVISPVGELAFEGGSLLINGGQVGPKSNQLFEEISALQRGARPDAHGWLVKVP